MFKIENQKNNLKNPYTLVFYKVKNKKEFFSNFWNLIVSIHNHAKFLNEYSLIKKEKLKLMKKVQENLREIDKLLILLKNTLPLTEEELTKVKIINELEKKEKEQKEKTEKINEEKIKTKEELQNLENMKDELKELEEKLLQFLMED